MKTQVLLVATAAAAVATLLSCTRELSVDITQAFQEMTFTAAFSDEGTKTAIQPNGTSVWWTGEESINVFTSGGQSAKFISAGTEVRATAVFSGSFSGSTDGDTFYAVYPYNEANSFSDGKITLTVPTQQTAVEGSFADDLFPSVAVSKNDVLRFYHVCGGARLSVSRNDIKQIVIKAKGEVPLAGTVKVGFNDSGKPVVNSCTVPSYEVRLLAPDNACFEPGKYYFAVLLPGAHTNGIEITYILSDGRSGAYTANSSISVNRALFGKLNNLDQGLEYQEDTGGIEPIDLGLSVKWAPFNVGATKPEEFGDYFAWGETEPKDNYNYSSYKWYNNGEYTKYIPSDGKTELDKEDDAASVNWGGLWRTPKKNEWEELIWLCTWTQTEVNGVGGYQVTGPGGNSIFLPAAGLWVGSSSSPGTKNHGCYWSASSHLAEPGYPWGLHFSSYKETTDFYSGFGCSVRPVYGNPVNSIPVESVSLRAQYTKSAEIICTTTYYDQTNLVADVYPSYATNSNVIWSSSDPSVATVEYGRIIPVSPGRTTVSVTTEDGGFKASVEVIVIVDWDPDIPVDMGLSVKWSSYNLGYDYDDFTGHLFGWGETEPKEQYFWNNYKFGNGPSALTKYCDVDGKISLDPEDDAANVILGGNWHTPSADEWLELKENCSWSVAQMYTYSGFIVESPTTGKIIFIPEGVSKEGEELYSGGYWSSSCKNCRSGYSKMMSVGWQKNSYRLVNEYRFVGHPIRPVYDDGEPEPEPAPLPEAIDLGLSVKWASFNLGASSPTERGWYFAWGETIPYYIEKNGRKEWKEGYEDGYDWASYRWSNGASTNLTKYVTSDKYGTVDNKTVLDAADDAARWQLGGNWRMPSKAEWQELLDNCIWEETKVNNVPVYRVKSKMPGYVDNYIILPRVSHMSSTLLFDDDYNGHWAQYWSSDLYPGGSDSAYCLDINWGTMKPTVLRETRCVGMPIRPVTG